MSALKLLSKWPLPVAVPAQVLNPVHCDGLMPHSVHEAACGDKKGPLQISQVIKAIKGCFGELDFILSDSTEFLTDTRQGTNHVLCRWLWFSFWAPWCALQKCRVLAVTYGGPWKSRSQTEMLSPLTESRSWLWHWACQNRCQFCLFWFSCVWNSVALIHTNGIKVKKSKGTEVCRETDFSIHCKMCVSHCVWPRGTIRKC